MMWEQENKYDVIIKSVGFVISPLLGVPASLYRVNTRSSFVVLFLSMLTFGLALNTPDIATETFRYDAVSYRQMFESYATYTFEDIKTECANYVGNFIGNDIFLQLLMFLVSRFTSNYHLFYMIVAMAFAFFYLGSLRYLVTDRSYTFSLSSVLLLFVFTLPAFPSHLSVLRWFMGCLVAIYAIFHIFISGNKWYYLLLAATCTIHGSFIILTLIMAGALVLSKYTKLEPILLGVSLVLPPVMIKLATIVVPIIFGTRFSLYINPEYIQQVNNGGSGLIWLERLICFILLLFNTLACLLFSIKYTTNIKSTKAEPIYHILIAAVIFVNSTILIPSVGSRFILMTYPFMAYIFLTCFNEEKFRNIIYVYSGFIMLCIMTFNRFYMLPCLKDYFKLWEPEFYVTSPLYSVYKYLIMS